jgi:predicted AAA+ superfamily ATPase
MPSGYNAVLAEVRKRLREPAPGRVQILAGPRQVGKTTLLLALADEYGRNAIYAAVDAPEASLSGWWDLLWQRVADTARGGTAVLLLDEIQYLPGWTQQLKAQVDRIRRQGLPVHVVVTGSSALLVGHGAKETMAGRFERLVLRHWSAAELASAFRLPLDEAVRRALVMGTFPGALALWDAPARWRAYIRDSIIEPAIGRDVLMLHAVRRPALLRQVFALCAGHPAEVISLQKLAGLLMESGALETIAHYLQVLEQGFLVAPLQKYSERELRRRNAPPKLVVLNQAFVAALHPGPVPGPDTDPERWGRWVENTCLAHAWNRGQQVAYWREEPLEIDGVITGSWGKWAVEVKTGRYTTRDLAGLLEFCRRYPEFRPLMLCDQLALDMARDAGVRAVPWTAFLAADEIPE